MILNKVTRVMSRVALAYLIEVVTKGNYQGVAILYHGHAVDREALLLPH